VYPTQPTAYNQVTRSHIALSQNPVANLTAIESALESRNSRAANISRFVDTDREQYMVIMAFVGKE